MFVGALFDYTLTPFLFAFGAFRVYQDWRAGRSTRKQGAACLIAYALAPVCAMAAMFLLNVNYWGSVSRAVHDLTDRVAMRTGFSGRYSMLAHVAKFTFASLWFYGLSVLLLMLVGIRQCIRRKLAWPVAALAAGLIWQCVFRNHSFIHAFTARYVGPGVFLCATVGATALLTDRRRGLRVCGIVLILLGVLRLPLGAEVSRSPIGLRFWQWAVHSSDSATLFSALDTARTTTEHSQEKQMLVDELAGRAGVAGDQAAYEFASSGKRFVLAKLDFERWLEAYHLPTDVTPDFVVSPPVYTDQENVITNITTSPVQIRIDGKPDKMRAVLLSFYLHLI
jgi:hypothetical protein